jgi:uncharacterized damage-inducible protein DinB
MERHDPDASADERTLLTQYLDHHRATLLRKVEGLDQAQLASTTAASTLHLAGLLKHLALVEHWWFREVLLGDPPLPVFADVDFRTDPDWEFRTAADDDPAWLVELYQQACEQSRVAIETLDLDHLAVGTLHNGDHPSVRWILLHMLEETARHNGHADLLREAIDGVTGE